MQLLMVTMKQIQTSPKKGTKISQQSKHKQHQKNSKRSHATIDDNDKVNINYTKKGQKNFLMKQIKTTPKKNKVQVTIEDDKEVYKWQKNMRSLHTHNHIEGNYDMP